VTLVISRNQYVVYIYGLSFGRQLLDLKSYLLVEHSDILSFFKYQSMVVLKIQSVAKLANYPKNLNGRKVQLKPGQRSSQFFGSSMFSTFAAVRG
jgi:hypothetical protein